jgi:hypothetical protein
MPRPIRACEPQSGSKICAIPSYAKRSQHGTGFGPRVMRGFLKHMALIQVIDGGNDFRFRVVGDAVVIQQGMALNGVTTSDLDTRIPGYGAQLARAYRRVVRHRAPLAYRGLYFRPADKHTFSHEALMAPLGDDGESVDHLIVVAA